MTTRDDKRFEAALRLMVANTDNKTFWETEAAAAVEGADALLAELERGAKEEPESSEEPFGDREPTEHELKLAAIDAAFQIDHSIVPHSELADLRRKAKALETLENHPFSVMLCGAGWMTWTETGGPVVEAPNLLALAEKISGGGE